MRASRTHKEEFQGGLRRPAEAVRASRAAVLASRIHNDEFQRGPLEAPGGPVSLGPPGSPGGPQGLKLFYRATRGICYLSISHWCIYYRVALC